ncbi:SMI1/KNR4 family protein [Paenacidovorax monticola]|uniref:SMI1/KNR4 family protein n=1 Tax=Paenacidovorax monticola TaxID=1926868 RepID=A0A7H0HJ71_9BURK|nr:SMI1/KNR4 family protein [Paenacidovorax monticola]QNP60587.1 SMI1/KNR4 family protein [Paenacidovorax monticola]
MTQPIRPPCFDGFDLAAFWADSDYARREYTEPPPTPQAIAAVEAELGYRLPASYVALMQRQNGGTPINRCFPTGQPTSWAEDHVAISAFKGIGFQKQWSLCGGLGSRFKIEEWEYPDIGVYFGDCPSAGHDMIALDYRACGPAGEPAVVHVDQEGDYRITPLAPDFETFVRGLVHESAYEDDPEDVKRDALVHVRAAPFNTRLQKLCDQWPDPRMPSAIRRLAEAIVEDKGYFALHADARSHLMYAAQFLLLSHSRPVRSMEGFLQSYPGVIAMVGSAHFGTGGWAPAFVEDWFQARITASELVQADGGWRFSPNFSAALLRQLLDGDLASA